MTTPENNPQYIPPIPEADPTLDALKAEVQNSTAKMIIDALKDATPDAAKVEEENEQRIAADVVEGVPFEGDVRNPDSMKGKATKVKKAVQSVLLAISGTNPKDLAPEGLTDRLRLANATDLTLAVLNKINEKVGVEGITEETAPYFQKLFTSLLTGQVTSLDDLKREYDKIGFRLASVSPDTYKKFRQALTQAAVKLGEKEVDALKRFGDMTVPQDLLRGRRSPDYNEQKIMEEIQRDTFARERLKLHEFYGALRTAESFDAYYQELYKENITPEKLAAVEKKIKERKRDIKPDDLKREVTRMAKENTAKEVHQRIIYLVNMFYKPVLVSAPDLDFNRTVSQFGGTYSPSPENMFRQLTQRITGITTARVGSAENPEDRIYMAFHQEGKDTIVPQQRTTLNSRNPMKEYEECNFDEFARQLKTIADTERNTMEFGHNFRFATNKGPQGDKDFFETITQFTKEGSFNTSDIDVITAVEYSELVQTAKIQLERRYKLAFSKMRWQRDDQLMRQVFESTNSIDREIRDSFMRDFAGENPGKYPEVIIDRCLSHARTLVYAKEFNLQLWASYSDPRLEKGGKASYKREELSGATSFNPVDDAIRWGDISDLNNNGELYLPADSPFDIKDHKAAVAKGKKEFHESFTFGHAAFEKAPPTIAVVGNDLTRGGGMDSLGGYRVRSAYDQWLDGLTDERTNNREINVRDTKDDVMVESWKRVENIGTNVMKNFMENFVLTDTHKTALERESMDKKGPKPVTEKYKQLFGFWYDRYLNDPDSVGKAYVKGKSKDVYVNDMLKGINTIVTGKGKQKDEAVDQLEKEKYKILSVVLFERSPLEFISMEKPRITQNGVTLMSQVQNAFLEDTEVKARKTDSKDSRVDAAKEFDDATADLVFIEQKARMDSIQQMDEIRKTNKLSGDEFNLYGDKTKRKSHVMQMEGWAKNKNGGYVIDEKYIGEVLTKQYENDKDKDWKVKRALKLYKKIKEDMLKRPDHNDEIDIYEGEGANVKERDSNKAEMKKKLKTKEEKMDVRMDWWSEAWRNYKFGMTFTADTADQFMDRSRTGTDTLTQAADFCANTAGIMKKTFLVPMKKACKAASMERSFKPLYDYLKEIKDPIDTQDMDISQKMMKLLSKRIINTMRKDEKAMRFNGDFVDALSGRPGSISETYTGEENFNRVWSWDRNDISDFVDGARGMTSGAVITKDESKKELKKYGHARWFNIFKSHILPLTGLAAGALGLYLLIQANKDEK